MKVFWKSKMKKVESKRAVILHHHLAGTRPGDIFKTEKNYGITWKQICRTTKRLTETRSVDKRKSTGRRWTTITPAMVKALREQNRRNPCRSQKNLALHMGVSKNSIGRAVNQDLGIKAFTKSTCHFLTAQQKRNR